MPEPSPRSPRARTKIIATVGPACQRADQLAALVEAGVNVFRLNMAHGTLDEHAAVLASIRKTSRDLGRPIAALVDLAGPKIRLGELPNGLIDCELDAEFRFIRGPHSTQPRDLTSTYEPLVDELHVGANVMLADGTVCMTVVEKGADFARARVVQPGPIRSRQGINLPGVKLSAPALNATDRANAIWAAEHEIDFVGLSFVRQAADVRELKNLLRERRSAARVVAKIEKPEAIEHLDGIVIEADAVMVARGDLGVEIDVAQMPVVQKRIVATCHEHQKPVIIATQMLDSMQHARRPTRAEVTDVANAILDGGDACMLSGETAIGEHPCDAVRMMNRIALATEEMFRDHVPQPPGNFRADGLKAITAAVVYGAGHIATEIDARMIVVATHSGATALALSQQRCYVPTVGLSDSPHTLRQMCLYWGVIPLPGISTDSGSEMLEAVTAWGLAESSLQSGDHIILVAGIGLNGASHNEVKVHCVP